MRRLSIADELRLLSSPSGMTNAGTGDGQPAPGDARSEGQGAKRFEREKRDCLLDAAQAMAHATREDWQSFRCSKLAEGT
jgi:hypothetical protein